MVWPSNSHPSICHTVVIVQFVLFHHLIYWNLHKGKLNDKKKTYTAPPREERCTGRNTNTFDILKLPGKVEGIHFMAEFTVKDDKAMHMLIFLSHDVENKNVESKKTMWWRRNTRKRIWNYKNARQVMQSWVIHYGGQSVEENW